MIDVNRDSRTPTHPEGTAHGFDPHATRYGSGYRATVTHREPMMWSDGMYTRLVHDVAWPTREECENFIRHFMLPHARADDRRGPYFAELDLAHWSEPGIMAAKPATPQQRAAVARRQRAWADHLNRD